MIVATRPDPTVLPPSRFVWNIITMFFHVFYWTLYSYPPIFAILFEVFKFFRTKIEPRPYSSISADIPKMSLAISKELGKLDFINVCNRKSSLSSSPSTYLYTSLYVLGTSIRVNLSAKTSFLSEILACITT